MGKTKSDLDSLIDRFQAKLYVLDTEQSWAEVKALTERIANLMLEVTKQSIPPVDLDPMCQLRLIKKVYTDSNTSSIVQLLPYEKGFILQLERDIPEVRTRTITAHEIGHTLFYDLSTLPPKKLFTHSFMKEQENREEWISFDFARFLLLPKFMIADSIPNRDNVPMPEEIVSHSRSLDVSIETYCHRVMRDLGFWRNVTCFTFETNSNRLNFENCKIYKGKNFKEVTIGGLNGVLAKNWRIIRSLILSSFLEKEVEERAVEYEGVPYFLQLYSYGLNRIKTLGILSEF